MVFKPSQIEAIYFEYSPRNFSQLYIGQKAQEQYIAYFEDTDPDSDSDYIANIFFDL